MILDSYKTGLDVKYVSWLNCELISPLATAIASLLIVNQPVYMLRQFLFSPEMKIDQRADLMSANKCLVC